ncbi:PIPO, partial [Dasheen mosaic virus]|uniref:PIPO n=1 Tax=Dasheen mosaic virus TaxID=29271 RepID=UPI0002651306
NFCTKIKTGMARFKLVGKVLTNLAAEKVLHTYGELFDSPSIQRFQRCIQKLHEVVFHEHQPNAYERQNHCASRKSQELGSCSAQSCEYIIRRV